MPKLSCKVREGARPEGKQKIWFTCHPDDREMAFQPVVSTILELQNCAVWYDEEPDAACEPEDLLTLLSQMQLFVIPVTRRLLMTANRTMDVEFPFAISAENHIPVLPILLEPGLDREFERKFGSLQYLDITAKDATQKSWREKLARFLSQVLAGDRLAEQVRETFDVYLFLSYRKKDRAQAQKLMRLLHENEFFRGVAIWYDEYLVPGENYNESILEALQKSPVFALTVTPNLVNEENYVAQIEYPEACARKKHVIPFELVPTDQARMYQVFPGISMSVPASDAEAVRDALKNALSVLGIHPAEDSPERDYYLGQAYLGGIDVEVNSEFALQFLTSAAEAGYLDAMEALADMYATGNRLPRDGKKARYWRERQVERLKELYESDSMKYLEMYSVALMRFGQSCLETGDTVAAKKAFEAITGFNRSETALKKGGAFDLELNTWHALESIALAERNFEEAIACCEKRVVDCRSLSRSSGFLNQTMESIPQMPKDIREKALVVLAYFDQGLFLTTQADPKAYVDLILANTLIHLSELQQQAGRSSQALDSCDEALEVLQGLTDTGALDYRLAYTNALLEKALLLINTEQMSKAIPCLMTAKPILSDLAGEYRLPEYRQTLGTCCMSLANVYMKSGKPEEAAVCLQEAADIYRPLSEQTYSINTSLSLASDLALLAIYAENLKDLRTARDFYIRAMNLVLAACDEMEETPDVVDQFSTILQSCDEFLSGEGEDPALTAWKDQSGHITARRGLAYGYESLGDTVRKQSSARSWLYYDRAFRLYHDLARETNAIYDRYHEVRCTLQWLCNGLSQSDSALFFYESSIEECEELIRDDGRKPEYLFLLCELSENAALCCRQIGSQRKSVKYFTDALNLHRELPPEVQTADERQMYCHVLLFLCETLQAANSPDSLAMEVVLREECEKVFDTFAAEDQKIRVANLYRLMRLAELRDNREDTMAAAYKIEKLCTPEILKNDTDAEYHRIFFTALRRIVTELAPEPSENPAISRLYYEKMLPLIEEVYRVTGTAEMAYYLCDTRNKLADVAGEAERACELYTKVMELSESLLLRDPADRFLQAYAAASHKKLAEQLLSDDRAERAAHRFRFGKSQARKDAELHLQRAIRLWENLAKDDGQVVYGRLLEEAEVLLKGKRA